MHDVKRIDFSRIAQDLQIRKVQVESVVQLLDEGNTVPFLTRYRKEKTGGLNEEVIRAIQGRVTQLRQLAERKEIILKTVENQGKLTEELKEAILRAETPKRLEDLYLPYKPKKRTLAAVARERGLEPLAQAVWSRDPAVANLDEVLPSMVNPEKELAAIEDVRRGVQHILAEQIAETAEVRAGVRSVLWETGEITAAKSETLPEGQGVDFKDYFQFRESARTIPPHRIMAINRGEKEGALKVRLESDADGVRRIAVERLPLADHPHAPFLHQVLEDALTRLLLPSLEREIRRDLTDEAEAHALKVFARNLRSLLLQPPLHGRKVLAIDPGFRTGCKLAVLDEHGNLLEEGVIFPHAPQNKRAEALTRLEELARKHGTSVIAIGNGTACRETEEIVSTLIAHLEGRRGAPTSVTPGVDTFQTIIAAAPVAAVSAIPENTSSPPTLDAGSRRDANVLEQIPAGPAVAGDAQPVVAGLQLVVAAAALAAPAPTAPPFVQIDPALPPAPTDLAYIIVNEAGASVYSASPIGREEFPNLDATLRGTISIGRRLQDPLSELVKIDPQNIGVGLYQHDLNPRRLKESVDAVIESSVNHVGVDLNTASVPLLRHVSGLNQLVARELVEYRKQHGPFKAREDLLQVPNLGPARFVQAAGFLKIVGGPNPLDRTWIHPESYPAARQLLGELGVEVESLENREKLGELRSKLQSVSPEEISARLQIGVPALRDLLDALERPGRDPREDLPPPIFKTGVLNLEDLQPGMELRGTVLNVVDFGAFVDIGLKDSGLVHISQMANRFIKNPHDIVTVGDVVTTWVLTVDHGRRRVSLTMIKPGTERRPTEKRPAPAKPRQPRGRRPSPPPRQPATEPAQATATASSAPPIAGSVPGATIAQPSPAVTPAPAARTPAAVIPRRRPRRQVAKPKLSQAALERKVPLRSFSELEVFFETKDKGEKPAS